MTKAQMLKVLLSPSSYRNCKYYWDLRKSVIEEAYMLYNNVSHKQGKKYLEKAYRNRENRIR